MYPLTASELGRDFSLQGSLDFGHLPAISAEPSPHDYLASYVQTYLREEVQQEGTALETLVFKELLAVNDLLNLGFELFYWRTATGQEVDFVLYGESGLIAIVVKRAASIRSRELSGLKTFAKDYPESTRYMFYGGKRRKFTDDITLIPIEEALSDLPTLLKKKQTA